MSPRPGTLQAPVESQDPGNKRSRERRHEQSGC